MDRVLEPLSNQWQIALLALIVVMVHSCGAPSARSPGSPR